MIHFSQPFGKGLGKGLRGLSDMSTIRGAQVAPATPPATARPELSLAVIEGLKRKGLSQSEIARMFGVTRQAVSYYVRKYGGALTPRQKALEAWPWMVPVRFSTQVPYKRLRDHGEYYATAGKGMSFEKLSLLRSFYQRLESQVVEFDPDLPPSDGAGIGGFAYRERLDSDEGLMIRINDHTHLSDEGRKVWVMPKQLPEPLAGSVAAEKIGKGLILRPIDP